MDTNAKLGKEWIPRDTHKICENGKLLSHTVTKHGLVVGNGHVKCKGVITRKRVMAHRTEESTIDHVILSAELATNVTSILIDEEQKHALTRITQTKTGVVVKRSDHNVIITELAIPWNSTTRKQKIEILNFKDKKCQEKFQIETSKNTYLSSAFSGNEGLNSQTELFLQRIDKICRKVFRTIKITNKREKDHESLYNQWNLLRHKSDKKSIEDCKELENELASKYSSQYIGKIENETSKIDAETGGFNSGSMWKLKKDMFPQSREPPTAMLDIKGVLQTEEEEINKAAIEAYRHRLRNRTIKPDLKELQYLKENICNERLRETKENKTPDWTIDELDVVLNHLKKDAARDPLGYPNEIFKPKIAGSDLKAAVLILMNKIKHLQVIPEAMKWCNISSIWKRKGPKNDFESYRGIFRTTVLRNILDRLIYNDEYPKLDKYLSDCNVGGRKGRSVRDNIFVLNAIMNSIRRGNKEAHDAQVYDVKQCFDALWLQECINALYEAGITNDKLNLLYLTNSSAEIAIKTSTGITNRENISKIVMQGTVWANMFCVVLLDRLGKLVYSDPKLLFYYKEEIAIPPLEMVDDVLSVQKCGIESSRINQTINTFMESEKLTLSENKCHNVHIGRDREKCKDLKVHKNKMHESRKERYLGDIIDQTGNQRATVKDRKLKGSGIVSQVLAITKEAPLGKWRMKSGLLMRNAWLVNSMLYNSEAWHGIVKDDTEIFSRVDESLLRGLVSGHLKVGKEALYLETGTIPIKYTWAARRLIYLQTILKRDKNELIQKVYEAQKLDPKQGDFIQLVQADANLVNFNIQEELIQNMDNTLYKTLIKSTVRKAAFAHLLEVQQGHSKYRDVKHKTFKMQEYMCDSTMNPDDISLLFAMRTKTVRNIRSDFGNMFNSNLCPLCGKHVDTISALLECEELLAVPRTGAQFSDIYSPSVDIQRAAVYQFRALLQSRDRILDWEEDNLQPQ